MNKIPWWKTTDVARAASARGSVDQIAVLALLSIALEAKLCVYDYSKEGNLLIAPDEFLNQIYTLGGQIISKSLNSLAKTNAIDTSDHVIVWHDSILSVSFDNNEWIYVKTSSLDKDLIAKIKEISEKNITQKTQGKAYVFVASEHGPELRQISGKAGIELERDNYSDKVLADFDHVIKDLSSDNPCAKLIIADGEPGTGKTYLVRGITNAVNGATFVLVPPSMIADMMSPQFIPVLMDHHHDKGPIVFIVEDADSCLVKREGDNMNSISSLLNLGAGMFGDLFDIRVICTTNATRLQMDKAITRNGRCCRYIETKALPLEQARKVFNKITAGKKDGTLLTEKNYTLADLYHAAHNESEQYISKEIIKVGF